MSPGAKVSLRGSSKAVPFHGGLCPVLERGGAARCSRGVAHDVTTGDTIAGVLTKGMRMAEDGLPGVDPALIEATHGFRDLVGYRLVGWAEGYARVELDLGDQHMNRYGIVHGGLHGVLMDTAMGFSGSYTGDPDRRQLVMTLSMTVNFLAPATGRTLIAEGRRTGGGRSSFFAEATVHDDTGALLATATGVFRYRKGGAG